MDMYSEEYFYSIDLYAYLGCNRDASIHEIRKLFRKLSLTCHPDKHPNDPNAAESFKFLNAVVEFLTNEDKRACYDRHCEVKQWEEKQRQQQEEQQKKRQEESYRQFYQYRGSYDFFSGVIFTNGPGFSSGRNANYWDSTDRVPSRPVHKEFKSKHGRPGFGCYWDCGDKRPSNPVYEEFKRKVNQVLVEGQAPSICQQGDFPAFSWSPFLVLPVSGPFQSMLCLHFCK